ncbi:hypothetical protein D3C81_1356100 [compost metagenome]
MAAGPVARDVILAQLAGDPPSHLGRLEQVLELEAHAFHLVFLPARHARGIADVDQRQRAVQLGADLEHADHGEALEPREHPGRRHRGLGQDEGQLVTDIDAETAGGDLADDDAELAALQIVQVTLDHMLVDDRDALLRLRQHRIDQHRLHPATVGEHALQLAERRHRSDLGMLGHLGGQRLPVVDRLVAGDGGVRHHAEDARAQLAVETVHHREHQDHHQHPEGETDHRGEGNERDEVVATFGTRVTHTDKDG